MHERLAASLGRTSIIGALVTVALATACGGRALGASPTTAPWILGYDVTPAPVRGPRPPINRRFRDPVHGTTLQRIGTDRGRWIRHEYSRRPAFNTDGSLLILRSQGGVWHLYRVVGARVRFEQDLPSPMSEPNWHPTDPHRYYHFAYNGADMRLHEYNVATGRGRIVADFDDRLPWRDARRAWTRWEGRPSDDGRTWCLLAQRDDFTTVGLFSYDIGRDQMLGWRSINVDPDHISTSVSGNHCVVSGESPLGTRAYSLDFRSFKQLSDSTEHSDTALDAKGRDVLVIADYSGADDGGWIRMAELATGRSTRLIELYRPQGSTYSVHIAGIASQRPGYAVVSTYNAHLDYGRVRANYGDMWGHDRLAVVTLEANPTIYNLAYMRNGRAGYFGEPQATVSRDLEQILFASTWGSNDEANARSYRLTLPSTAFDNLTIRRRVRQDAARLGVRLRGLPLSAYRNRDARSQLLNRQSALVRLLKSGDWRRARSIVRRIGSRFDGCGRRADRSDYIVNCNTQRTIRVRVHHIDATLARLL